MFGHARPAPGHRLQDGRRDRLPRRRVAEPDPGELPPGRSRALSSSSTPAARRTAARPTNRSPSLWPGPPPLDPGSRPRASLSSPSTTRPPRRSGSTSKPPASPTRPKRGCRLPFAPRLLRLRPGPLRARASRKFQTLARHAKPETTLKHYAKVSVRRPARRGRVPARPDSATTSPEALAATGTEGTYQKHLAPFLPHVWGRFGADLTDHWRNVGMTEQTIQNDNTPQTPVLRDLGVSCRLLT